MYAKKGKAVKVEKERGYGRKRATAYVIMQVESNGNMREEKVKTRHVIDFWNSYERERNAILEERRERERIFQAEREKRQREAEAIATAQRVERERREAEEEQQKRKLVAALIARTGMPEPVIYSVGATSVSLDRTALEFWLSTPDNRGTH